ncbi:MAG: polysaccharide deacetylase family protein [Aquabacterium sp.]|uniref:polysaccharide deacetylase family protein n=1 Tax=Aquabacterium sp. TaxID=1872578 RepID=UPI0025C0B0DE|nr:polysaccharide deacetylase family protein [Aquabacterium sp.]MBI5925816.1 polysaccharide deacetylase family protein [Aquabacterium sp.]
MRRATDVALAVAGTLGVCLPVLCLSAGSVWADTPTAERCDKPVYLTIDTGHMGVAPLIVDTLQRHGVKATFFLANERTQRVDGKTEGSTLDAQWAPWWKALASQGHDFGSHTWDHLSWQADVAGRFRFKGSAGPQAGQVQTLTAQQYCAQLAQPARRFQEMTGQSMRAIFRAPGGKTSPALLAAAKACGWQHVPWTPAGFLGDELSSDRYPNAALLNRALKNVRQGEILLMHLGIWSRQDPWAPAVLEPLIVGLQARGLCFATLRAHPDFAAAGPAPLKP